MLKEFMMDKMPIKDVRSLLVETPAVVHFSAPIEEVIGTVIENTQTRHVYVVDDDEKIIGSIRLNMFAEYLFPLTDILTKSAELDLSAVSTFNARIAKDIMDKDFFYVKEDDHLSHAAQIMIHEKINELPVVDDEMRIIGQINVFEMLIAYLSRGREM